MNTYNLKELYRKVCKNPGALLVAFVSILLMSLSTVPQAQALYLVSDMHQSAVALDSSKPAPVLNSDLINVSAGDSGKSIRLKGGQTVVLTYQGKTWTTTAEDETVASLLKRADIQPSPLEMVSVTASDKHVAITVSSDLTMYERVDEPASYKTVRRPNPNMKKGEEKVVQEGVDGVCTAVYEVVWSNGEMISRQFVEKLDSTAQDKIIEYGTATTLPSSVKTNIHSPIAAVTKNADGSGTLTLSTGEVLPFSGVKNMKATAYTAGHDGVGTRTATGTHVRRGTVAVDKRVVPLGTRMYIVSNDGSYVYGLSVAEDTGYVGNNLDLYHDTYQQCINFGRRGVTVYFLK